MTDKLAQLKTMTEMVADTGDIKSIAQYQPVDATTNPSLLLKAAQLPHYQSLLGDAVRYAKASGGDNASALALACDHLAVAIGAEILALIPGRISTEVDARLSFETAATVERAERIIGMYEARGIPKSRVLIKIASTFEGIEAARQLEKRGINCNLTLLFGFAQARACADAGVFLISPFVGRILDWYKASTGQAYTAKTDPGVQSVTRIYNYYRASGYDTIVMGASFRNTGEIEALAGCDRLTISPALMEELQRDSGALARCLAPETARSDELPGGISESEFRWAMNEDAMATEKLAEGIRNFAADQIKLELLLAAESAQAMAS